MTGNRVEHMAAPLLRFDGVTVAHRGSPSPAVVDVSFAVYPGETVAIVGRSGSGKSTVAMAAMGLLPESAQVSGGTIEIGGVNLTRAPEREWADVRGSVVGLIPQDPAESLNPLVPVGRQVEEALPPGTPDPAGRVVDLLGAVGLPDPAHVAGTYAHEVSGGMKQRALVAAALAGDSALIIADEPTSALDAAAADRVLDLLQSRAGSGGRALVLITHDLALLEARADRVLVIDDGHIVESGPTAAIIGSPQKEITGELVDAARRVGPATRAEIPSHQGTPLLSVRNVRRTFPGRRRHGSIEVLRDVSFDLHPGECVGVVGPSGVGKSTLANIILGLDRPTSGEVFLDGIDVHSPGGRTRKRALRRRIQPVFQNSTALNPRMTVSDAIKEPLVVHRIGDADSRDDKVAELLGDVGLPESLSVRRPFELSGGQRQRVAIARALALEPDVLVLDEAFNALDSIARAQMLELLAELHTTGRLASIVISHDRDVIDAITDTVVMLQTDDAHRM